MDAPPASVAGLGNFVPLLPGTRAMYNVREDRSCCEGFRGYCGGLAARLVIVERELAATALMFLCMYQPDDVIRWSAWRSCLVQYTAGKREEYQKNAK